jgi:hypothetical protein
MVSLNGAVPFIKCKDISAAVCNDLGLPMLSMLQRDNDVIQYFANDVIVLLDRYLGYYNHLFGSKHKKARLAFMDGHSMNTSPISSSP